MLEWFEVERRKVFVLATRVGATVLAFDFAKHADNCAWIDRFGRPREPPSRPDSCPVGHRRGPNPLIEPSRQPVDI